MDARELGDSLTDQLLAPFARVNYGSEAPVPYWRFDVLEAEDRQQLQAGAEKLLNFGLPLAESYVYRVFQGAPPKPGEPTVQFSGRANAGPPQPAAAPPPADGEPATDGAVDWDEQELVN
jgi:phage gp29-like protein